MFHAVSEAPPGVDRQILNHGDESMKVACVFVPPVPANHIELAVELALTEAEAGTGAGR